ncbi:MAG: antitoxin MazE5 [Phycicoccus sp.]|nr:antitoxin MazE5 [Phycicoccus sp.]
MSRRRLRTTVDARLLASARSVRPGGGDAGIIDEAAGALLPRQRATEIEQGYAAYDEHPLTEPDAWGDLASFREAAS